MPYDQLRGLWHTSSARVREQAYGPLSEVQGSLRCIFDKNLLISVILTVGNHHNVPCGAWESIGSQRCRPQPDRESRIWRCDPSGLYGFRARSRSRRLRPGACRICHQQNRRSRGPADLRTARADRRLPRGGGGAAVKYLDEYRAAAIAKGIAQAVRARVTRPWVLMEICGGQTHTIMRYGLDEMLPREIELVHGPGCPVCVAPLEIIDKALAIAARPGVIFVSYGDMLRVPGSHSDLFRVKAAAGDVRIAYSPMDAVKIAAENPDRQVVFFGIGFETTAPANAISVWQAKREGLRNFSLLAAH